MRTYILGLQWYVLTDHLTGSHICVRRTIVVFPSVKPLWHSCKLCSAPVNQCSAVRPQSDVARHANVHWIYLRTIGSASQRSKCARWYLISRSRPTGWPLTATKMLRLVLGRVLGLVRRRILGLL